MLGIEIYCLLCLYPYMSLSLKDFSLRYIYASAWAVCCVRTDGGTAADGNRSSGLFCFCVCLVRSLVVYAKPTQHWRRATMTTSLPLDWITAGAPCDTLLCVSFFHFPSLSLWIMERRTSDATTTTTTHKVEKRNPTENFFFAFLFIFFYPVCETPAELCTALFASFSVCSFIRIATCREKSEYIEMRSLLFSIMSHIMATCDGSISFHLIAFFLYHFFRIHLRLPLSWLTLSLIGTRSPSFWTVDWIAEESARDDRETRRQIDGETSTSGRQIRRRRRRWRRRKWRRQAEQERR